MNQVKLPKIAGDLQDELDGLRWAFSGETAYQIYTDESIDNREIEAVMHLKDYGEAALRTGCETDTRLDDNGLKVFRMELERHTTPIIFETTNLTQELDIFERLQTRDLHGTAVPLVPPEYLLATVLASDTDKGDRLRAIRDTTSIDKAYLRECMRVIGVESDILGGGTD